MEFDYKFWEPLLPSQIAMLFSTFPTPWCIAGGWGLDLFLGRQTREHEDIDVVILRRDQLLLQRLLTDFEVFIVDPPGALRVWMPDEYLSKPLYNIWVRRASTGPWKIQVMIQDHTMSEWLFRRDNSIKGALENLTMISSEGIPILRPEIQLLYKAKAIRERDNNDFDRVLPHLSSIQRYWLRGKIEQAYGPEHRWLRRLAEDTA